MKKAILLSYMLIIALLTNRLNAQTTMEEYNYVVKGYKVQLESGLDMKKGYELVDVDDASAGERKVTLKKLVKTSPQRKTVAYMVTYRKGSGATEYICIPHPSSDTEIRDMYWKALYAGDGDSSYRLQLIAFLLSRNLIW
jgi:hypothetical protein